MYPGSRGSGNPSQEPINSGSLPSSRVSPGCATRCVWTRLKGRSLGDAASVDVFSRTTREASGVTPIREEFERRRTEAFGGLVDVASARETVLNWTSPQCRVRLVQSVAVLEATPSPNALCARSHADETSMNSDQRTQRMTRPVPPTPSGTAGPRSLFSCRYMVITPCRTCVGPRYLIAPRSRGR